MKNLSVLLFLITLTSWKASTRCSTMFYDKAYELAFTRICQDLSDSTLIVGEEEILVSDTYFQFNTGLLADKIRPNAYDLNMVIDSLTAISVSYTKTSIDRGSDLPFSNKKNTREATKLILFFTRLSNNSLQAYLFTYNPKRQANQYLQSHQGFYRTYLFKFDESGNIENFYRNYCSLN